MTDETRQVLVGGWAIVFLILVFLFTRFVARRLSVLEQARAWRWVTLGAYLAAGGGIVAAFAAIEPGVRIFMAGWVVALIGLVNYWRAR